MRRAIFPVLLQLGLALPVLAQPYYVAPTGSDRNPGTLGKPFATIQHAQQAVRQKPGLVWLRGGTYYLPEDPQAARNPLLNYSQVNKLEDLDRIPGPRTQNFPANCLVEDCLIYLTGRVEKQTAGVDIDLAQNITIRHCSIYDMPRAGINIGDGCWGGHVIEFRDVFDTVKETEDHGSFNSWGARWRPKTAEVNAWVKEIPELPRLNNEFLEECQPNRSTGDSPAPVSGDPATRKNKLMRSDGMPTILPT